MSNSQFKELIERESPFVEEFDAALNHNCEQRFLDKSLPFLKKGKCRAIGIHRAGKMNRLPILRPDQHPSPLLWLVGTILVQHSPKHRDLFMAPLERISRIANKLGMGRCLRKL